MIKVPKEKLFWLKVNGGWKEITEDEFNSVIKRSGLIFRIYDDRIAFYQGTKHLFFKFTDREMVFLNKKQAKTLAYLIRKEFR